jgi:hypothetical protein
MSEKNPKNSDVFWKISHVFGRISDVFDFFFDVSEEKFLRF